MESAVHEAVGVELEGCPWRAFDVPIVGDVVEAYPFFEKGCLDQFCGPNPPAKFIDALALYHSDVTRLQNEMHRAEAEAAKQKAKAQGGG